ncbi:RluA family pseudouridine synthase [Derxia gummosa]|uniref:Pseudouridine synthase n=1 Tax=Derxia gummosa DSM 723 TaxID=1121388 RepID=A0A8B6X996_9BURK|nr:RluA family pseudouridine synthase [Derxia gummosa]
MVSNSGTASAAIPGSDDAEHDDELAWPSGPHAVAELTADVPADAVGERIDRVVARLFSQHSRARIQGWIDEGRLSLDGRPATARTKLRGGERIVLVPTPDPESLAYRPEPLDFPVVHEDAQVIVIDKPAGLVVHPAAGNWSGTLLNGLLHRYPELATLPRAGIVHRLDKDTSGLMVVARTLEAQTDLVRQLQARSVSRRYLAVCWGRPADARTVDAPIGRDQRERTRMAVVPHGKPAITHLRRLATAEFDAAGGPLSLVECRLDTGRTHQIRVHAAHLGFALVGDPVYGNLRRTRLDRELLSRQALHAWRLAFDHPASGERPAFAAEPPPDFVALCERLGLADGLALADQD